MDILEQLDKGLIDFGVIGETVDGSKYNYVALPITEPWGILMRRDSLLSQKQSIQPEDLWDKPLILSRQALDSGMLTKWLKKESSELNIVATYSMLYNGSLLVDEGFGYALCFDKIINTSGNSNLCFRPLSPKLETGVSLVWKKYQVLTRASEKFLNCLMEMLES